MVTFNVNGKSVDGERRTGHAFTLGNTGAPEAHGNKIWLRRRTLWGLHRAY